MDNTLENKAKFFALYWGQRVEMLIESYGINATLWLVNPKDIGINSFLELKPLSSISDEDAIEVTKILKYKEDDYFVKNFGFEAFEYLKDEINESKHGFLGHVVNESSRVVAAADYLRSQGYAIPWNELSVEKLVEYGWVKLKESEVGNG